MVFEMLAFKYLFLKVKTKIKKQQKKAVFIFLPVFPKKGQKFIFYPFSQLPVFLLNDYFLISLKISGLLSVIASTR